MDNYIEVVSTDKRGEAYLVLTLKRKGKAYRRTIHVDRREKRNKVLFKVSLIVFGALIGQIVKRWLVPVLFG